PSSPTWATSARRGRRPPATRRSPRYSARWWCRCCLARASRRPRSTARPSRSIRLWPARTADVAAPSVLPRRRRSTTPAGRHPQPVPAARRRPAAAEQVTGWAFVTPGAAIILLFGAVPIVWSAVMSFQRNNLLTGKTPYVGLRNYRLMLHDPVVAQAVQHTFVYTALFVPGTMIVGLFLAVAMNRKIRFISVYRTAA